MESSRSILHNYSMHISGASGQHVLSNTTKTDSVVLIVVASARCSLQAATPSTLNRRMIFFCRARPASEFVWLRSTSLSIAGGLPNQILAGFAQPRKGDPPSSYCMIYYIARLLLHFHFSQSAAMVWSLLLATLALFGLAPGSLRAARDEKATSIQYTSHKKDGTV